MTQVRSNFSKPHHGPVIAYQSMDEVNQHAFRRVAKAFGVEHQIVDNRDVLSDGGAGLVIDLDSWPFEDRQRIVAALLDKPDASAVCIHSYDLNGPFARRLRRRGVRVFRRLGPAIQALLRGRDESDAA